MPLDLKIPKYGHKSSGQYYYSGASERYSAGPADSTITLEQVRGMVLVQVTVQLL